VLAISNEIRSLVREKLKIRPEGSERINMAISWEIKKAFQREKCRKISFSLLGLSGKNEPCPFIHKDLE